MLRALALCLMSVPALACDTALVLSLDVSGSIDAGEYALQAQGLAFALSDPDVAAALVRGQVALAVVQWSGVAQQAVAVPWRRMLAPADVAAFAAAAAAAPRAFKGSDTAVGQGLRAALAQFARVPDCTRRVVDISGDGQENAGFTDARASAEAFAAGVIVNAIAIEDPGQATPVTQYFRRWVVTPGGFAVTTRGLRDYAGTLRLKLLRELLAVTG
jgi:Ca-activated chloride channel family protein